MVDQSLKSLTKTQSAFHRLRLLIEEGRLKPGDRLRTNTLMKELDMSPTPIREALRLLQAQGLVEHEPHHGMVVARYSPEDAEEVYRLRVVLEPMATELAAVRASEEQIRRVREQHTALKEAVESGPLRVDVAELNAAWHRTIYAGSGSRYLEEFIARLWGGIPVEALWLARRARSSVEEHEEITAALEYRDASKAAELMRRHIEHGAEATIEHLRRIAGSGHEDTD